MWERILKRGSRKGLDYNFLKEVTLHFAKLKKGKTLTRDQYLDFLEMIRSAYSTHHTSITIDRIQQTVTKILKRNNLLEVERVKGTDLEDFYREYRVYIFKWGIKCISNKL